MEFGSRSRDGGDIMNRALVIMLRSVARSVRRVVKSSPTLRNLFSDFYNAELFTDLRTHEKMLCDSLRVESYRAGLAGCVKPGDVVLDLGTGTGILSLLAAVQRPKLIYAVDHSPFIEIAREIAARNKVTCIEFVHSNSRDFTPPEPIDVVIHEQMGSTPLEENMIENLLDLKRRVLKSGGRIEPGRFDMFVEPIVMKPEQIVPYIADIKIDGVDLSFLGEYAPVRAYRPAQYSMYPNVGRAVFERFLSRPRMILSFDLNAVERSEQIPSVLTAERTIEVDGPLDGFCVYFRTEFGNRVSFDTSPLSAYTHWFNRVYRADRRPLRKGDTIRYTLRTEPITDPHLWPLEVL